MANHQIVVFELDKQEYGIDALTVNGILQSKKFQIRKAPGLPRVIEGMINLRGQVNYIFNLGVKFGLEKTQISDESKFIMLNIQDSVAGCIADEVTDIVNLADEDLQPSPAFISSFNAKFIKGIGKVEERMIVILDPEKILSTEEYKAITETTV